MSTIQITNINDLADNASLVTDNGGIKTDKLTGKTTAGSISVVGEGNSTTTNLQQGLVKSYMAANGQGTISVRGSFNATSLTDHGTGEYQYSFVNNMQNNEYVPSTCCQWDQNDDNKLAFSSVRKAGYSLQTNQLGIGAANTYTALLDVLRFFGQVVGDLA